MPSFYTPELTKESSKLTISGPEYHHIVKVFRHKVGDKIFVNSGKGVYAEALIVCINKKDLICDIRTYINKERYNPKLAFAFSLLRNKNDNLLIEKLTELGVSEFFPFESDYSVRKASHNTLDKFKTTAIEAIKQCDNGFLPLVNDVKPLIQQLDYIEDMGYQIIIASEIEKNMSLKTILPDKITRPICVLIGPEGGFSPQEFNLYSQRGYLHFKLGINILRAETAGICACSQLILKLL